MMTTPSSEQANDPMTRATILTITMTMTPILTLELTFHLTSKLVASQAKAQ